LGEGPSPWGAWTALEKKGGRIQAKKKEKERGYGGGAVGSENRFCWEWRKKKKCRFLTEKSCGKDPEKRFRNVGRKNRWARETLRKKKTKTHHAFEEDRGQTVHPQKKKRKGNEVALNAEGKKT